MRRLLEAVTLVVLLSLPLGAQEPVSLSTTTSRRTAAVTFGLADGRNLTVSLRDGRLSIGDRVIAEVPPDGAWAQSFREVVSQLADVEPAAALEALLQWEPPAGTGPDAEAFRSLVAAALGGTPAREVEVAGAVDLAGAIAAQVAAGMQHAQMVRTMVGPVTIEPEEVVPGGVYVVDGDLIVAGRVEGDVVALRGDIRLRRGAYVAGDVVAVNGRVRNQGASIEGRLVSRVAAVGAGGAVSSTAKAVVSVIGVLVALALIGFGLEVFAPRHLEVGAETVRASLGRSFATGLLGQALLVPTLVMLVVGLCITIVGIIAVPFAVLGYALLAAAAVVGGFVTVAQLVGERVARHRLAQSLVPAGANGVWYLLFGLAAFGVLWMGVALFSSVPVANWVFLTVVALLTWLALTIGLGAALLSRLGFREGFAGRITPQITDEYLFPTPMPAQRAARTPSSE